MDTGKARMEVFKNLPPRHARGCPQNILRSVMWQLSSVDLDVSKKLDILTTLKEKLPCLCPKVEETP